MENTHTGLKGILWAILVTLVLIGLMYAVVNFIPKSPKIKVQTELSENKYDSTLSARIDSISLVNITINKISGIPAILKSNYGQYKANEKSSLTREWIVLNEAGCPVQLSNSVGINTSYVNSSFYFTPAGSVESSESISAFELHHVLYNVFGEHIKTLSNVEIADVNGKFELSKGSSWYGTDNELIEYMSCVSYVATVKTKSGTLWTYNPLAIKRELNKIQISYEEDYRPPTISTEKK